MLVTNIVELYDMYARGCIAADHTHGLVTLSGPVGHVPALGIVRTAAAYAPCRLSNGDDMQFLLGDSFHC
jgi:hypothetical protein